MQKKNKSENINNYLSMIKMEYSAMREEIRISHTHIFVILQLYFPVIGVLIGIGVENKGNRIILYFILAILIPTISLSSIIFILSESLRMKRAGDYICILESKTKKVNVFFNKFDDKWQKNVEDNLKIAHSSVNLLEPLGFERWIRNLTSKKKVFYGRASLILQLRFIILFIVPFISIIVSILISLYDMKIITCKLIYVNFGIQIIGFLMSFVWGILILINGFKLSNKSRDQITDYENI